MCISQDFVAYDMYIYERSGSKKKSMCKTKRKSEHCNTHTSRERERDVLRIALSLINTFTSSPKREEEKTAEEKKKKE
jgi:hypothetical protein